MSRRPLPDSSRLAHVPEAVWHRFRARLEEIGLTEQYVGEITKIGDSQPTLIGAPLRNWHARRVHEPAACAARMLMLEDPVSAEDARMALGAPLLDALMEAGLIAPVADGGLVSGFNLVAANQLYLISDHLPGGEDAVMGATSTTGTLYQASQPARSVQRMLDLGCGAGSCALLLADRAAVVVGADINARAITLSKVNAVLNGIANADFREGDLFAPVRGENFDLIVSQPPWFARPEGAEDRVYLFGGARGDEISLRILGELPRYLAPRGRAVLLVEWPLVDEASLEDRVAAAVTSTDCNVLLLKYPAHDLDDYCTRNAMLERPELDDGFARAAVGRREYLEKMGIRGLMVTLVVIQHNDEGLHWSAALDVPAQDSDWVTGARIDRMVTAQDLLAGDAARLLTTRLRVPDGTVFAREYRLGKPVAPKVSARFPHDALVGTIELGPGAQLLLTLVNEAPDVASAMRRYAEGEKVTFDEAVGRLFPPMKEALRAGMLEPA
jgi:methylase of polypeptide subunit release factors